MPQMSPMMWSMMLMITSFSIIQMNSMLFFEFKKKKMKKNKMKKTKEMNWKW